MPKQTTLTATEIKKPTSGRPYKHMLYERDPYNVFQNFLFKRAIYGISVYTDFELQDMDLTSKKRIEFNHHRTQMIINLWKQDIINKAAINFFNRVFPDCKYIDVLKKPIKLDPYFRNHLTLKELGINKKDVIERLISQKILPTNFFEINMENLNTLSFSKKFNY